MSQFSSLTYLHFHHLRSSPETDCELHGPWPMAPQEPATAAVNFSAKCDDALPPSAILQGPSSVCLPLTKKERGRFKKLLKRATAPPTANEHVSSGISSNADWVELLHLREKIHLHYIMVKNQRCAKTETNPSEDSSSTVIPGIQIKRKRDSASHHQIVEAKLHRDLLLQLMHTILSSSCAASQQLRSTPPLSVGKKRKLSSPAQELSSSVDHIDDSPKNAAAIQKEFPLFHTSQWACIHNPVAVSHLAIIELHVSNEADTVRIQQYVNDCMASNQQQYLRTVMTVPTHWFHKNQSEPQSMTHTLMYASNNSSEQPKSNVCQKPVSSINDLIPRLEPFILSKERLLQENYPMEAANIVCDESHQTILQNHSQQNKLDFTEKEALLFIEPFQIIMQNDSKPALSPFVVRKGEECSKSRSRRIFGIDCEMVETAHGLELARVTVCELTEWHVTLEDPYTFSTCLDVIVQPRHRIHNYHTQYSGISATTYQKPSTPIVRLEQVQAQLLLLIDPLDIVIGHSLENDLQVLRWIHPTVIDTAILFQNPSKKRPAFKYSLRHLAAVLLNKQIQNSDRPHCSIEDATTAMELAIRRAVMGPSFGISPKGSMSNWLADVSRSATAVCVGPIGWLQQHVLSTTSAVHALQCEAVHDSNLKAVLSWLSGPKRRAGIVWSQLDFTTKTFHPQQQEKPTSEKDFLVFQTWLQDVIARVPANVVMMICLQTGYPQARAASEHRRARRDPRASMQWSDGEEEQYQQILETCRNGTVLWIGGGGI